MTSFAEAMTERLEGSEVFGYGWKRVKQGKWVMFTGNTHEDEDAKILKDAEDSIGPGGLQSSERSRISRHSKDSVRAGGDEQGTTTPTSSISSENSQLNSEDAKISKDAQDIKSPEHSRIS